MLPRLSWALVWLTALASCKSDPNDTQMMPPDDPVGTLFERIQIPFLDNEEAPNLFDVWGNAHDDVWVVGEKETVVHFDGVDWSLAYTPTSSAGPDLRSVWSRNERDVFAVGTGGIVLHYTAPDAQTAPTWVRESLPGGVTPDLNAVYGSDTETWVAGNGGLIFRRDAGGVWAEQPNGVLENINAIWVSRDGLQGAAVGNLGVIARYNGAAWGPEFIEGLTQSLRAVYGNSGDDLFIMGLEGKVLRGALGGLVEVAGAPLVFLRDYFAIGGANGFAVGWNGTIVEVSGDSLTAHNEFTSSRLEGVWGTIEPDPDPPEDNMEEMPMRRAYYVVGVSGSIFKGPFGVFVPDPEATE